MTECPTCDYDLSGIDAACCPECGQALDGASLVQAEYRRALRHTWTRVIFLASPAIGFFPWLLLFMYFKGTFATSDAFFWLPLFIGASMVASAFTALWYHSGKPGRRRTGRSIVLAFPLALAYAVGIAVVAVIGIIILIPFA
jgi:hypothetical protein